MTNKMARVVSWESEELILVDENDEEVGTMSKAASHDGGGVLHRAFSLFLFDAKGRLLLQRRAASKRLWPMYWSNSVCSHPRHGETIADAVERRVADELGLDALSAEFIYKFRYQASYEDLGSEHELCHVFLGRLSGDVDPNRSEIEEVRFIEPGELTRDLERNGSEYTPWFRMEWQRLSEEFGTVLARYATPRNVSAGQPTYR